MELTNSVLPDTIAVKTILTDLVIKSFLKYLGTFFNNDCIIYK